MPPSVKSKEIYHGAVLDVDCHAGNEAPAAQILKSPVGDAFDLNSAVVAVCKQSNRPIAGIVLSVLLKASALPYTGSKVLTANQYGLALWGQTGEITEIPDGATKQYSLKTVDLGHTGRTMKVGEYESLKAMCDVSPRMVPEPYGWGKYDGSEIYFLLNEFREVGRQPAESSEFTKRLAEMHKSSQSPTGKFGFHLTACHATLQQVTDCWEESCAVLPRKQLAHMVDLDEAKNGEWPESKMTCQLIFDKVIPRLLEPLQSNGRAIKPCLVHGDLWDENTATDAATGEPFIFDARSFYAHNEYDIGDWRAPRHRLSAPAYVKHYRREYRPSEPVKLL